MKESVFPDGGRRFDGPSFDAQTELLVQAKLLRSKGRDEEAAIVEQEWKEREALLAAGVNIWTDEFQQARWILLYRKLGDHKGAAALETQEWSERQ
jgi:hypothetical protein